MDLAARLGLGQAGLDLAQSWPQAVCLGPLPDPIDPSPFGLPFRPNWVGPICIGSLAGLGPRLRGISLGPQFGSLAIA